MRPCRFALRLGCSRAILRLNEAFRRLRSLTEESDADTLFLTRIEFDGGAHCVA
jgi:hypothetical protein